MDECDLSTTNEDCWQNIQEFLQVWPGSFPDQVVTGDEDKGVHT